MLKNLFLFVVFIAITIDNESASDTKSKVDGTVWTCISWIVRALIELGGGQAILGLHAWVKKHYGIGSDWIIYAADMACGRFVATF